MCVTFDFTADLGSYFRIFSMTKLSITWKLLVRFSHSFTR